MLLLQKLLSRTVEFILSTRMTTNTQNRVQNSFGSLRWQPTTPEHLNYINSQFLLIGESEGIANALEHGEDGKGDGKPREELEKLEDEDTHRMVALKGDDSAAIFADLGARAGDYPKLETTF